MAFQFRGERFNVDLPSDDEDTESAASGKRASDSTTGLGFIKDISERAAPKVPTAPTTKTNSTGFPAHKRRAGISRFKQERAQHGNSSRQDQTQRADYSPNTPTNSIDAVLQNTSDDGAVERDEIDKENKEKLSKMSDEEIGQERQELMQQLSPSLIQRLLRRANIDEPQATDFPMEQVEKDSTGDDLPESAAKATPSNITSSDQTHINNGDGFNQNNPETTAAEHHTQDESIIPREFEDQSQSSIHFPRPPEPPPLDPSSPNFLTDLHEKYFPNLPHDPSKLEWMNPSSSSTDAQISNKYASAASSLPISALRFSFTGALLPPNVSNSISTSKGLHHHGDSPESAGYTIAELAHLARSSFPTQRCFAFQTLGRILYRLGIGEFGKLERGFQGGGIPQDPSEETEGDIVDDNQSLQNLAKGLWACIREGRVLETLEKEASRDGGHVSAKAYATEALWLWQKGGGTEVRAT